MRTDAKEIEKSVSPGLDHEKDGDEQPDEDQRKRRGCLTAEGERERQPGGQHRPVGRRVEPRPPYRAAIHFATIKVRQGCDIRRIESRIILLFVHCYLPADLPCTPPLEWGKIGHR